MNNDLKATIILKHLDNVFNVNWTIEEDYKKAIIKALKEIESISLNLEG